MALVSVCGWLAKICMCGGRREGKEALVCVCGGQVKCLIVCERKEEKREGRREEEKGERGWERGRRKKVGGHTYLHI